MNLQDCHPVFPQKRYSQYVTLSIVGLAVFILAAGIYSTGFPNPTSVQV